MWFFSHAREGYTDPQLSFNVGRLGSSLSTMLNAGEISDAAAASCIYEMRLLRPLQ